MIVVPWLKCCNDCAGPEKCKSKRGAGHWSTLEREIDPANFNPKRYKEIKDAELVRKRS